MQEMQKTKIKRKSGLLFLCARDSCGAGVNQKFKNSATCSFLLQYRRDSGKLKKFVVFFGFCKKLVVHAHRLLKKQGCFRKFQKYICNHEM